MPRRGSRQRLKTLTPAAPVPRRDGWTRRGTAFIYVRRTSPFPHSPRLESLQENSMRPALIAITAIALPATLALAQTPGGRSAQGKEPLVEFEMMTWPEVKAALEAGKTTALIYT